MACSLAIIPAKLGRAWTLSSQARVRGQQLKDQAQLDGWLRDGSARYLETLLEWR